jgi:hypothetical protein
MWRQRHEVLVALIQAFLEYFDLGRNRTWGRRYLKGLDLVEFPFMEIRGLD